MVERIDPSVIDKRDKHATDASPDMYNPANGLPHDAKWLRRYCAPQRAH